MRSPGPRKTVHLSDSIHRQLNSYALAATAAGVGALALAQPAQAKIVYTLANTYIVNGTPIDLNHDHEVDFRFATGGSSSTNRGSLWVEIEPASGSKNRIWGRPRLGTTYRRAFGAWCSGRGFASNLPQNVSIGSNPKKFQPGHDRMVWWSAGWGSFATSCGPWKEPGRGFLGLKFTIKGEAHYGWASVTVGGVGAIQLEGYAYETIPNKPIVTNRTKGPDVITLQSNVAPGSLGRLALGWK